MYAFLTYFTHLLSRVIVPPRPAVNRYVAIQKQNMKQAHIQCHVLSYFVHGRITTIVATSGPVVAEPTMGTIILSTPSRLATPNPPA